MDKVSPDRKLSKEEGEYMFVQELRNESNKTKTENGAITYKSSLSNVLDLFSRGGAFRSRPVEDIKKLVHSAASEDILATLRVLFYLRDVRGGQGERRLFREALKHLAHSHTNALRKNLQFIPLYGRFDDLFALESTPLEVDGLKLLESQFKHDLEAEKPSLLAKWMPSENATNLETKRLARKLAGFMGMRMSSYRKCLTKLRASLRVVERDMCANRWNSINFSAVPSRAAMLYRKPFSKHDGVRYTEFLESVKKGEAKINASTLYPYDLVMQVRNNVWKRKDWSVDQTVEAQWKALPNFMPEGSNALVVADTSGSMTFHPISSKSSVRPLDVSLSLAVYFAERNVGPFKDLYMIFSNECKVLTLQGETLHEKISNIPEVVANTNVQSVFDKVLEIAVRSGATQAELPSAIFLISDMEFDTACKGNSKTNFEEAKVKFAAKGYTLPQVVFWNVDARNDQSPVRKDDRGAMLVSGCSPSILKYALNRTESTPLTAMLDVIESDRYAVIQV